MNMTDKLKASTTRAIKIMAITAALVAGGTAQAKPHGNNRGPSEGVAIAHEVVGAVNAVAGLVATAQGNPVLVTTPAPAVAAPVVAPVVTPAPVVAAPVVAAPVVAAPVVAPVVTSAPVVAPGDVPPGVNANVWRKMQRRMNKNHGPNENVMRKIERRIGR